MSASWTRAQLRAAEAAWASWQTLLADEFLNNDDSLLAAVEARSGITQAELYHQRIEADRSAGVFRQFADPGKAPPSVRPVVPAEVWRRPIRAWRIGVVGRPPRDTSSITQEPSTPRSIRSIDSPTQARPGQEKTHGTAAATTH